MTANLGMAHRTIQPLRRTDAETLGAFLADDAVANLYLLGILEEFGCVPSGDAAPFTFYGRFSGKRLNAVLFVGGEGGLYVPAGPAEEVAAIAEQLPPPKPLRSAVGERTAVDALVQKLDPTSPRILRAQNLLAVSADDLGPFTNPTLRLAREDEADAVLPLAAGAVHAVSELDPMATDPEGFSERVRRRIRAKRTYVLEVDGQLVFKIDVGSRSAHGAELEGLYTVPAHRNQGHATLSLGQICRHLLSSLPRLTLRVDEESQGERIARKIGFLGKRAVRLVLG